MTKEEKIAFLEREKRTLLEQTNYQETKNASLQKKR